MLRLAKLPNRVPVKITFSAPPDLEAALQRYAELYAETYGQVEPLPELIPAMLAAFLESDRTFAKSRTGKARDG